MILFYTALVLLTGLLFGKLAKLCKLPNVTGYLVGGLLIGPSVLGSFGIKLLPDNVLSDLGIIPDIALGFIAFTIGTSFQMNYFKRVGSKPIIIAIFESLIAVVFVFIGLVIIGEDVKFSLVLSAIAAATAPAATLMVIKQYKAKGEVTETLMSVVALDDAVALIIFGIMVAVANNLGISSSNLVWTILKPFLEILASLTLGTIIGILLTLCLKWFTGRSNRICVIVVFILLVISSNALLTNLLPSINFEISTLLSCMMLGAVFANTTKSDDIYLIMGLVDRFTPPFLIMFFVISGANLKLAVLTSVGLIGVIYIVFRVIGKVSGAYLGSVISKAGENVKKYLGWTLIPQAGVAIGLTIVASSVVPQYANEITAVVLCATLIYELTGPLITKTTLKKAKEITIE